MINDNEYSNVVDNLSLLIDPVEAYFLTKEQQLEALKNAIGCSEGQGWQDQTWVERLIDLIERPKCKKEEHDEHYWRCTRCGGFICWDAVTDCCGVIPTRYCPWCGAEVKE